MIRKGVIAVLSVGTLVTLCLLVISYARPTRCVGRHNLWVPGITAYVDLADGEARLTLVRYDHPQLPSLAVMIALAHASWRQESLYSSSYLLNSDYAKSVSLPLWLGVILLAAYPAGAFICGPVRRRRRRRKGLCLKCGYDLTGNVSGTCPECGTEIKKP